MRLCRLCVRPYDLIQHQNNKYKTTKTTRKWPENFKRLVVPFGRVHNVISKNDRWCPIPQRKYWSGLLTVTIVFVCFFFKFFGTRPSFLLVQSANNIDVKIANLFGQRRFPYSAHEFVASHDGILFYSIRNFGKIFFRILTPHFNAFHSLYLFT